MSKEFRLATGDEVRGALEYGDQVYVMLDTESSTAPVPPQDDAQPVAYISASVLDHLMAGGDAGWQWIGPAPYGSDQVGLFTRSDAGEVERLREAYVAAGDREHALRDQLAEAHSLFADVLSIDVPRTAQSLERMRSILSASDEPNNQCDGCRAGIPLINGMHRMGKPGGYPDLMACTSKRYDYDPDEPANKEGAQ